MAYKNISPNVVARQKGATIAELAIAIGLSSMLLVTLTTIYLHSVRSFSVMENHMSMDNASRLAMDAMSREIRGADKLVAYSTNKMTFLVGGKLVSYNYHPDRKVLIRETELNAKVLLEHCDFVRYELFQRTPDPASSSLFPAATPDRCKVVRVTWLCSRPVMGQVRSQTTMRSAQIVMRNQKL